ncbi:hypothetical protein A8M32_06265 [Sinorhizobium alkalisoli]|uniref:Uncharacterized protein n=1 Tax=Sinorhizobium alkalisoli TaxID=1752398 RepID=A0A1E3VGI3_9HYPH|nr:hypothetical protein A8M32_06265 [Sinorhizobium alkalisoli]
MGQELVGDDFALCPQVRHGVGHIDRVPIDDCRDDEVQARRPVLLGLMTAVDDAPLSERVDGLRQGMALLAFVEPGVASAAQCRVLRPVEHEQGPLDLADFLEGDIHLVLALIDGKLP